MIIPGWINVDIRYLPGVNVVDNAKYLRQFKDRKVSHIYACHILEHFNRWESPVIMKRWYDLLVPGGKFYVSVPDFEAIAEYYQETRTVKNLIGLLYGGQDYKENHHLNAWDFITLHELMEKTGYICIRRYDWKTEKPFMDFDDYSKCYIPHKDFEKGKLMSLNVKGEKI